MTLTATPGSATADAFVTVADCDTYCTAHGLTDWTGATASPADDKEAAIRRATAYLSNAFSWKGWKTNARAQALAWPRIGVEDEEGNTVASDAIPVEIVQACCHIAAAEAATPGVMNPTVDLTARVKREKVGPLETEYASVANQAELSRPVLLVIGDLVGGLIAAGTNSLVGSAIRS
tara:strand:+ start:228 stop:758 length:531 start_codon:yes stop_codon:yes gene_type:complete